MANYWLGVDLGGTKVLAGVFDDSFKVLAQNKQPTLADQGPKVVFGQIDKAVSGALKDAEVKPEQVRAMGMCVPGQVDPGKKLVRYAPNLNWKNFDLTKHLSTDWKFPVFFENDVKLGTYGEYMHGAARGARIVLGIFVGTGVGGGIIMNGEIYSGFNFCAGEIGHTIVHWRKGTELEALAGRRSMMERVAAELKKAPKHIRKHWERKDPADVKSSHLSEYYYAHKDPLIVQMVDDAAMALGAAVGSAINFLSPEVIVIGGGVAGALGAEFLEDIWDCALRYVLPGAADGVRFVPAALKDDSGIFGAAAYARARVGA